MVHIQKFFVLRIHLGFTLDMVHQWRDSGYCKVIIFINGFQVSYGLHELLRNNAANIHSAEDWAVIFSLLEVTVLYLIGSRYIQLPILWSYKLGMVREYPQKVLVLAGTDHTTCI
jgi:hypothetical protein